MITIPQLVVIELSATWAMVGLIWIVQLVHYPAFAYVSSSRYREFQEFHMNTITWIVMPLMLIEIGSSLLLWILMPGVPLRHLSVVLLLLIWGCTFFVQVPQHQKLLEHFQSETHTRLVQGNWIRTILWTARGLVLSYSACQ